MDNTKYIQENTDILTLLKSGNKSAFKALFFRFFTPMCSYAFRYLQTESEAEDVVQDIFIKFWNKKEYMSVESSLENYLFRCVKNSCLNIIKHRKVHQKYVDKDVSEKPPTYNIEKNIEKRDIYNLIEKYINKLPEKRQQILRMCIYQEMTYGEVAEELDISVNTVKTQVGLAYKSLRKNLPEKELAAYLLLMIPHLN